MKSNKVYTNPKPKTLPLNSRAKACGYPPPRRLTLSDLAKASIRSRRGDDASNPLWKYDYDTHRDRIMKARALVDTSSPIVSRNLYSSPAKFNRSIANFVRIERENAMMLERIATIMKGPGTVLNRLPQSQHSINVRSKSREMALLRIAFDNLELWKRIQSVRPSYDRKEQLKDFKRMERIMEILSFYPLYWKIPPNNSFERLREQAINNAKMNPRPQVYFDLETDDQALGRIVIELRADIVPMTAENFRCLCTGEMGPSYKCSEIHKMIPEILWQGGEVVGGDGRGGKSIFGDLFPDENFKLKHSGPGIVSMANCGKDTNGSQFIITATRLGALDGVNVVMGKVIGGLEILQSLRSFIVPSGSLKKKIWIAKCGSMDSSIPGGGEYEDEEYAETEDERPPSTRQYEAGPSEAEEEA